MEVNDYVRTKYGEICKLKKSKYKYLLYETDIEIDRHNDRDCNDYGFDRDTIKDVIKSSPNIKDLIEVGDYVNGEQVSRIKQCPEYHLGDGIIIFNEHNETIYSNFRTSKYYDITSIVTKEQFESMEYKVSE